MQFLVLVHVLCVKIVRGVLREGPALGNIKRPIAVGLQEI